MKKAILFTFILLISFSAIYAQKWREIDQSPMGIKYKLPDTWEVDGFGSTNFDDDGSSVCDCAGTINIGNRFEENEIYMVLYPARTEESALGEKRNQVWGMVFDNNGTKSKYVVKKKLVFDITTSTFTKETEGNYPDNKVMKIILEHKKQYYVIFFWAKPEVLDQNMSTIYSILDSFKPNKFYPEE